MKSLEEVIEAEEICSQMDAECSRCPYKATAKGWCEEKDRDALHYLKVLKDILDPLKVKNISHEITCPQCNSVIAILLPESNEPLTWDELKAMEGKPVWVEFLNYDLWTDPEHHTDGSWWVVGEVRKDDIIIAQYLDEAELCEEDLGEVWQAYRKERK